MLIHCMSSVFFLVTGAAFLVVFSLGKGLNKVYMMLLFGNLKYYGFSSCDYIYEICKQARTRRIMKGTGNEIT